IKHFELIANSTDLPVILYNVPSRTGVNIAIDTLKVLSQHENIVAVKEASGSISHVAQTRAACGDNLDIYSGNDDQIVPILSLGGKGVISVLSNIMPKQTHDICELFAKGNVVDSAKLQIELIDLIDGLFSDVNPIPVKEAMNIMGFDVGECRLPLCNMSQDGHNKLADILRKHNLIK
ncbi:MAG: dihydrodipicolinate synthase family protein, partial [Oscillospiraceae bacterium]